MAFLVAVAAFSFELARFGAIGLGLGGNVSLGTGVGKNRFNLRDLPDPAMC
jgi:hypothetical protein